MKGKTQQAARRHDERSVRYWNKGPQQEKEEYETGAVSGGSRSRRMWTLARRLRWTKTVQRIHLHAAATYHWRALNGPCTSTEASAGA